MMMSKTQFLQQQAKRILANSIRSRLFRCSLQYPKEDSSQWQKPQGDQVNPSYVRGLIKKFRDTNEFSKALEASEWMCEQKVFNVFPKDYAARLHLVETVLGLEEAEKLFKSIPENMKDYSVYNTLLRSYTKSVKTLDKAESTFEKMRDLGFLLKPSPFDSMISLYGQLNKQDMVEKCQEEKNLLSLVKIKEIEKSKTADSIEKAVEMYGDVRGSKSEVHRLWDEYKKQGKMNDDGYRIVIKSLLKLDEVEGAEKIYEEWKPFGQEMDMRIPNLLISRFCLEGNDSKVEEMVESIKKKKMMMNTIRAYMVEKVFDFSMLLILSVIIKWFGADPVLFLGLWLVTSRSSISRDKVYALVCIYILNNH